MRVEVSEGLYQFVKLQVFFLFFFLLGVRFLLRFSSVSFRWYEK